LASGPNATFSAGGGAGLSGSAYGGFPGGGGGGGGNPAALSNGAPDWDLFPMLAPAVRWAHNHPLWLQTAPQVAARCHAALAGVGSSSGSPSSASFGIIDLGQTDPLDGSSAEAGPSKLPAGLLTRLCRADGTVLRSRALAAVLLESSFASEAAAAAAAEAESEKGLGLGLVDPPLELPQPAPSAGATEGIPRRSLLRLQLYAVHAGAGASAPGAAREPDPDDLVAAVPLTADEEAAEAACVRFEQQGVWGEAECDEFPGDFEDDAAGVPLPYGELELETDESDAGDHADGSGFGEHGGAYGAGYSHPASDVRPILASPSAAAAAAAKGPMSNSPPDAAAYAGQFHHDGEEDIAGAGMHPHPRQRTADQWQRYAEDGLGTARATDFAAASSAAPTRLVPRAPFDVQEPQRGAAGFELPTAPVSSASQHGGARRFFSDSSAGSVPDEFLGIAAPDSDDDEDLGEHERGSTGGGYLFGGGANFDAASLSSLSSSIGGFTGLAIQSAFGTPVASQPGTPMHCTPRMSPLSQAPHSGPGSVSGSSVTGSGSGSGGGLRFVAASNAAAVHTTSSFSSISGGSSVAAMSPGRPLPGTAFSGAPLVASRELNLVALNEGMGGNNPYQLGRKRSFTTALGDMHSFSRDVEHPGGLEVQQEPFFQEEGSRSFGPGRFSAGLPDNVHAAHSSAGIWTQRLDHSLTSLPSNAALSAEHENAVARPHPSRVVRAQSLPLSLEILSGNPWAPPPSAAHMEPSVPSQSEATSKITPSLPFVDATCTAPFGELQMSDLGGMPLPFLNQESPTQPETHTIFPIPAGFRTL
jgi:hypothetical protein